MAPERDKWAVAQSFSRAAASYDSVAQLQRAVGNQLLQQLPTLQPARVVDLGSGTGYFTDKLQTQYPAACVLGLDMAEGMLRYARDQRAQSLHWLAADMEALPLADASVDLLFTSLALQWCEDLPAFFRGARRALVPGGCLAIASLGPKTLFELRDSWRQVDDYVHVNDFVAGDPLRRAATEAGLVECSWRSSMEIMRYDSLKALTHELKSLGAHNVNHDRAQGLTGPKKLRALLAAYEAYRTDGVLPASYEVQWLIVHKPL